MECREVCVEKALTLRRVVGMVSDGREGMRAIVVVMRGGTGN